MKKNYGLFAVFIIIAIALISYCAFYVFNNINSETYTFSKDGYALYVSKKNNYKTESYSFANGSSYSFKKSNNKISFSSSEKGNVNVDESTVIHYSDNSLLVLKKVAGLDVTTINNEIIFYYNIYKNTNIIFEDGEYSVTSFTGEKINFKNLLLRITENKYLFVSDSIRATVGDEVIDFGNYVYIEYISEGVVSLYNNTKTHQTIGEYASVVSGDITINLGDKSIAKEGKKYITLSNVVLDSDSNIDLIPQETQKLPTITNPDVNTDIKPGESDGSGDNSGSLGEGGTVSGGTTGGGGSSSDNNVNDEVVDDNKTPKTPEYRVVNMSVTPIKIDAEVEIIDEDSLISSPTNLTIVNNANLKVVYETTVPAGDTSAFISSADLTPDTEYTIIAKANYTLNNVEYNRTFLSKIFRTEALGLTFNKSYATPNSLTVSVDRDEYSDVSAVTISVYTKDGARLSFENIDFSSQNSLETTFYGLEKNTEYKVVMHEILCDGVSVDDGYSEEKMMFTLKESPYIGNLNYQINKRTSTFELSISNVKDEDYGIVGYRYEVFRVDQNMNTDLPIATFETDDLSSVSVNVDEVKLFRGSAYTYRVIVVFNDNDKIIEYVRELGTAMQMEGVPFPTIRFDETKVTWEQINGTIIIDDPGDTIEGDEYRVMYKNSVDVFTTNKITASTSESTIPIAINNLRKDETYTFQVYADVNLRDGNETIDEAYIGSVIVQTSIPQELTTSYTTVNDYSSAFGVNLRLSSLKNQNAELEASTISEITFTLYQGTNTNGAVEVFRKVVDLDNADYVSTIKTNFYDTQTLINPEFFEASNSDFTEKNYTLKISNVYDYTQYKNEIFVQNNEIPIVVNSYVPDLPDEESVPIVVTKILNKNATSFGLENDPNLQPNTIVGYNVISNYANESKNATRLVYHVWSYNHLTKSYVNIKDEYLNVNEDGTISNFVFPVGYGTENTVFDNDQIRRGNEIYFTYEVYLDIDGDGTEDAIYPKIVDETAVLKSDNLYPDKESPSYEMYPSTSTASSANWKYKIKDLDNALESKNLYAFVGNNINSSSSPAVNVNNSEYSTVSFTGLLTADFYSIKSNVRSIKSRDAKYTTLSSQYLYPINNNLNLTYSAEVNSNTLIVRIDDYEENSNVIDSIASVDVIINPLNNSSLNSITLSNVLLDNGVAFINLINYPKYINTDLEIGLKIYFDSGNTGFDVPSTYKALQKVSLDGKGNYYSIVSNKITQNSVITGSEFTTSFEPLDLLIKITNKKGSKSNLKIEIDERGVLYSGSIVTFKELIAQSLTSTNNEVKFDLLVPSISLLNAKGKIDIVPLLTSAVVNAKVTLVDGVTLKDDLIYVDLFETDENGTNAIYLKTLSMSPTDINKSFTISDLNPQSNYYINFYTYIHNSTTGTDDKYYLYDENEKAIGLNYNFYTLSDVGINNITSTFVINSYEDKKININYTLESIYGYHHIAYDLYEQIDGEFVLMENVEIPNAEIFFNQMSVDIPSPPGNEQEFSYGKTYKIVINPIGYYESNEEQIEINLGSKSFVFTLDEYIEPYVGISASKTDSSVFFRVSIEDTSKLIYGGVYEVRLMDSNYNVLETFSNISANTINKRFDFDAETYGLKENASYIFVVAFDADYNNSGADFTPITKSRSIVYGNSVNMGAITASKNATDDYAIDIIFADSYMLDSIEKITYTVSSTTVTYFSTGTGPFNIKYNSDSDIYTYKMDVEENANFTSGNVYTITMNFYTKEQLVAQEEISYYYTGGE